MLAYDEAPRVAPLPFPCNDPQNQIDNVLQEVTPAGAVVWSWSSRTRIALDETTNALCDQPPSNGTNPTGALDLIHTNSVSLAPDGTGDVIISARSLDAVLRIRRNPGGVDDGRILWKLGGTTPQSNATVHYTMTGDPLGSFLRQHDAALLANGHVVLFDNQSPPPPGRPQAPPRALEIDLDPNTETARIVRSVPWPGGAGEQLRRRCGAAAGRRLDPGHLGWAELAGLHRGRRHRRDRPHRHPLRRDRSSTGS